ncbi:ATP-binding cassette domain-containing protein [Cyanobium sp. ATX 6A2]|uniref:ATP-binding cassette domain-containing protein n=1 Tax=Cyanobium sp. ATX 6A2 TaxID=2823700 RepID=UPI0037C07031
MDRGEARTYAGNYATYLARQAEEEAAAAAGEARLKGVLRRELEWLRRGPQARSTKQKARIQRIEALQELPRRQQQGQLSLASTSRRLGKRAIEAEALTLWPSPEARSAGAAPLISDFSYDFSPEDRVGIIGPNGSGKSSLLNLIAAAAQPGGAAAAPRHSGRLELGSTVKLAYFDQHSHVLESACDAAGRQRRVIDLVQEAASTVEVEGSVLSASQLLERFLFPPAQQFQPVSRLSGGERRRLHLCRLLIGAPNVLLLDEPTNDLDVQTLTVLEDFLEDFRGCVVVVSHDRYFLDRTVDRLFVVQGGRLERFEGNYSAYLEQRRAPAQPASQPAAVTAPAAAPGPSGSGADSRVRRRSYSEKRELARLEQELPQWEEQHRQLEALLSAGGSDYSALQQLTVDLAALSERIGTGEERWLELSELAE